MSERISPIHHTSQQRNETSGNYLAYPAPGRKSRHHWYTVPLARISIAATLALGGAVVAAKGWDRMDTHTEDAQKTALAQIIDPELNGAPLHSDHVLYENLHIVKPVDDTRDPAVRDYPDLRFSTLNPTHIISRVPAIQASGEWTEIERGVDTGNWVVFKCAEINDPTVAQQSIKNELCAIDAGYVQGTPVKSMQK